MNVDNNFKRNLVIKSDFLVIFFNLLLRMMFKLKDFSYLTFKKTGISTQCNSYQIINDILQEKWTRSCISQIRLACNFVRIKWMACTLCKLIRKFIHIKEKKKSKFWTYITFFSFFLSTLQTYTWKVKVYLCWELLARL